MRDRVNDLLARKSHLLPKFSHSFSRAGLMFSIGYQQLLQHQSTSKQPATANKFPDDRTSSSNIYARTFSKVDSNPHSHGNCCYCKQPGHCYNACPHRFDNKMLKESCYCQVLIVMLVVLNFTACSPEQYSQKYFPQSSIATIKSKSLLKVEW